MPSFQSSDAVVVGGGIAGLACAVALADAGLRVTVFEGADVTGGRARSWRDAASGDVVDIGPHIVLSHYRNMLALLRRLGTAHLVDWQTEELLTVADEGRAIPIRAWPLPAPLHMLRNLARILPSASLPDLVSNAALAVDVMRRDEAALLRLDGESARSFLERRGVRRHFIDWFWSSASMALLNVPPEHASATALTRLAAQMLGHNDYRFGFATRGLSELYVPACVDIVRRRGGEVSCGRPVTRLAMHEGRARGVVLADGTEHAADAVVLAVPPQALVRLVPDASLARDAARFVASPYVSCYLWFDTRLTRRRFWARPWRSERDFNTDFYDLANLPGRVRAPGSVIATNIIWSHRTERLTDEEIVAVTLRELAEFVPAARRATLLRADVHRIPMSIPCPHPGTETLRPPAEAGPPGVTIAGDWTRTGLPASMESAVRSAALAAEAVLAARGTPRRLALPVPETRGLAGLLRHLPPPDA